MRIVRHVVFFVFGAMVLWGGLISQAKAAPVCAYKPVSPTIMGQALKRGVNVAELWQRPPKGEIADQEIERLARLGFDFVRLPIDPVWLEGKREDELAALRCDVVRFLNAGLSVIVDLHPTTEQGGQMVTMEESELLAQIETYWRQLAPAVKDLPAAQVYLGVMNEPPMKIANWWEIQGKLVQRLRLLFPQSPLIVSDRFGLYGKLLDKKPYPDANILYDFHFYTPMFFTHHNAKWVKAAADPREASDSVLYPAAENKGFDPAYSKMQTYVEGAWDKAKLEALFDKYPVAWSRKHGVKVVCLEFGVYRPFVDNDSRLRWLSDVREILEANAIPWALWNYKGGYGLFYGKDNRFDPEMAARLGLSSAR